MSGSDELLDDALEHQEAGRWAEAQRAFEAAIEADPEDVEAHFRLGVFFAHRDDLDAARRHLDRACELDPESVNARNALANVRQLSGDSAGAIAAYEQALAIDPDNVDVLNNLGRLQVDGADPTAAVATLSRAVEIAPDHPLANLSLAVAHERTGNLSAATTALRRTSRLDPDLVRSTVETGLVRTLEFKSDHLPSLLGLARLRLATGGLAEARSIALRILASDPKHADALRILGSALVAEGEAASSLDVLERAVVLDSDNVDARLALAEALERTGPNERSVALLREAVENRPDDALVHFRLGLAFVARGEYAQAAKALRETLGLDSRHPAASHLLAAITGARSERPPDGFVEELFDEYAPRFERHLVDELGYRVPEVIAEALGRLKTGHGKFESLLDIGCGTGLSGTACRGLTRRLTGIDISRRMIEQARAKDVYDTLEVEKIDRFLASTPLRFDAIVAADVLIYVGALERIFEGLERCTEPGACFGFSIEREDELDYRLAPSARYAHGLAYIDRLAEHDGWVRRATLPTTIRKHGDVGIDGYVVVLERGAG